MKTLQTIVSLTPTLTTSPYSDEDQIGSLMTIANAVEASGDYAVINSICVIDKEKQKAAFDILFFSASPTVTSSDNAALNIADAEMTSFFLGRVSIPAASYADTSGNSDCTVMNVGLVVKAAAGSKDLFCILQSQGTPTYVVSSLVIKIGITQS